MVYSNTRIDIISGDFDLDISTNHNNILNNIFSSYKLISADH